MKSNKGITLVSLIVYIIIMFIVLGGMSAIVNTFYKNNNKAEADTEDILQFNHFNTYFLKEVKTRDNKVDRISNNYILFSSGNSFSFKNNQIYYNNIPICEGVQSFMIIPESDNSIINVNVTFKNFSKSMNYKVEEIY